MRFSIKNYPGKIQLQIYHLKCMNNTRYVNNKAILSKLSDLIDKYPDMRFNQLLWATGIIANDENGIIDKFYEESEATWRGMCNNTFCFPPNDNS